MRFAFAAACLVIAVRPVSAHFKLNQPTSYDQQDALGSPQKSAPCGQADPGDPPVLTNQVTTVMEGSQLAISINEEVFHPGHYRVSIAQDMNSLPADPQVTAGTTPCGTAAIEMNPTLPVLADDLLDHTSSFNGVAQTMMVQLPPGMTCDHCILQITEFMSDHPLNNPGGCFYHHCATVTVSANAPDAGPTPDGPPSPDAGNPETGNGGSGGCCDAGADSATTAGLGVMIVAMFVRRRRG
jgi:hypothetical protein